MASNALLGQQAECPRCGARGLAKDLIQDGRNPELYVLSTCGCYDPPHLAEVAYVPKTAEGKAPYQLAPEIYPDVEITLEAGPGEDGGAWTLDAWDEEAWAPDAWEMSNAVALTWDRPTVHGARIEEYEVWRSIAEAAFELITTTEFEYSDFMEVENDPEDYVDTDTGTAGTYQYYVEAVTGNGRRYRSNTVTYEVT